MAYDTILTDYPVDTSTRLTAVDDQARAQSVASTFFLSVGNLLAGSDRQVRGADVPGNFSLGYGITPDGRVYQTGTSGGGSVAAGVPATVAGIPVGLLVLAAIAYAVLK